MGKGQSTLRGDSIFSSSSSAPSQAYVRGNKKNDANSTALVLAKSKTQEFDDAMTSTGIYRDAKRIIWDYSFDSQLFKEWSKGSIGFFYSSLEQEILSLAYYAAPLDDVERYVRAAHAKNEQHLSATLQKATIEAIKNLDVNILDEKEVVIAEGMAERLMKLHKELRPNTHSISLNQIRHAVPFETTEEKKAREDINVAAVKQVFDAFVQPDGKTIAAEIKTFNSFVSPTTQLNRLHLLFAAFDELIRRGGWLPGGWYGARADRFCFEVIGAAIEMDFSPRMRKILEIGVYYILNRTKNAERQLDIEGAAFIGVRGSDRDLGVNSYFDVFGRRGGAALWLAVLMFGFPNSVGQAAFQNFYEQLHQRCELMQRSDTRSRSNAVTPAEHAIIHRQF
jgi:hypothetical protein